MSSIDSSALKARKELFIRRGETVADWAKDHGFDAQLVYAVLSGRLAARRGQSHHIAVALGLKQDASTIDELDITSMPNIPRRHHNTE